MMLKIKLMCIHFHKKTILITNKSKKCKKKFVYGPKKI